MAVAPAPPVERFQNLIARLESIDDDEARGIAEELVGTMLELYGEGLERIVHALDAAPEVRDGLAQDGVVASLLLIHGLYPVPIAERVEAALESVRPYMESHGGGVELVRLEGGIAHLRLHGSCDGCPASASTLELAIREALDEAAPDLDGIEVEGVVEAKRAKPVPLSGHDRPVPGAGRPDGMGGAGRRRGARDRGADAGPGGRRPAPRRERRRNAARLPERLRRLRGAASSRRAGRRSAHLRRLPAPLRAAARRSRGRARISSSRRCRCSRTWGTSGSRSRDRGRRDP